MNFNLLLVTTTPLVLYSAVVNVANVFRTKPLNQNIFYSNLFVYIFLVAVVLFGVLRNIRAYPFTMLAP